MNCISKIAALSAALTMYACGGSGGSTQSEVEGASERPMFAASQIVFSDDFSRPDSAALGSAIVGGAWAERNELYSPAPSGPDRYYTTVYPTWIALEGSALAFRYTDPQHPASHASPYAYAPLSRTVLSATLAFDFTPPPTGGRIQHSVGLMTAATGFWSPMPASDYGHYYPGKGVGILIGREWGSTSAWIQIIKSDGTNSDTLTYFGANSLPFALNPGVTYHLTLTLGDDQAVATISDGAASPYAVTVPLGGFAFLIDQVFVNDEQQGFDGVKFDNISVSDTSARIVAIDVAPGAYPNSINLGSAGVVPVAILSDATFDATQVDPASVVLGGATVKLIGKGSKYACSAQDVNGDGRVDLVCHVSTDQLTVQVGDSLIVLEGSTIAGQTVRGTDSIKIVP